MFKPTKVCATQLDAWPVVSSMLFEITPASDDIVSIVDRAGLTVDWDLSTKEAFSHSTRKRAYRPRVHKAYSTLSPEDRDTVLSLIIAELARRFPARADAIKTALKRIGWTLKSVPEIAENSEEQTVAMKRIKELQKLLLLQVRNGTEPDELSKYSEQDQVYNSALLINDGYVDGQAIEGGSGQYVSTVMIQLTSKGQDFLEALELGQDIKQTMKMQTDKKLPKLIFVSHSSKDEDLAEAIVDMLCAALSLRRADFVCTSVDGSKLRGGEETDDALRDHIRGVPAFLSLLTPHAVSSTYVLFELGARWGNERHHIPLLAKGAGPEVLKEPLKSKNALNLAREPEVLQLVEDLGHVLQRLAEPAHSYIAKVRKVLQIAQAPAQANSENPQTKDRFVEKQARTTLSDAAKKLLVEASKSSDGTISRLRSASYGEVIQMHSPDQGFLGKRDDPRSRALWLHAFDDLIRAGFLESLDGSRFRVTHVGYELVDVLKGSGVS